MEMEERERKQWKWRRERRKNGNGGEETVETLFRIEKKIMGQRANE